MYSMTMHGPPGIVEAGVVQGDGVGVLEARHQQRFALEALAEHVVGGDVVVHDLDHHLPAEVELAGEVDLAHAPLAELADGLVATQRRFGPPYALRRLGDGGEGLVTGVAL